LSITWKLGLGDDIVVDADRVLAMTSNVHPRPNQFRQQGHTDISTNSSAETDTTTTGDIWWHGVDDVNNRPVGNPKRRCDEHSSKFSLSYETKVCQSSRKKPNSRR
jgi:hypothetical protein